MQDRLAFLEAILNAVGLILDLAPFLVCLLLFAIACLRLDRSGQTFRSALSCVSDACVAQIKAQPLLAFACLSFWLFCDGLYENASVLPQSELLMITLSIVAFFAYSVVLSIFNIALVQRMARTDGLELPQLKVLVTTVAQLVGFTILLGLGCIVGALLVLPAAWIFLRLALAPVNIILQKGGTWAALVASWRLTSGHFWLTAYLLLPVLILQLLPGFVIDSAGFFMPDMPAPTWLQPAGVALNLILVPLECVLDFLYIGLSYQLYRRLKNQLSN